ncbi:hypothetical protein [Kiritimatiella glycovorans]|uniref:Antitoxin n=1 Tax=Kiritimatiella glycovorans TaxID=1307763 RepID=A0A0G3EB63_9BACT|nr:hypothetical protein [Kiritimatiella glycovorans]AKJ63736.1 hypothetical protein L21SP4_00456 [Kiritimatiella glycovorans]
MSYMAVKDLKKTRVVRETLEREGELVLTRDGRPFAVMFGIEPDSIEESLSEIRRALFSSAVRQARRRSAKNPVSVDEIQTEIESARREP